MQRAKEFPKSASKITMQYEVFEGAEIEKLHEIIVQFL